MANIDENETQNIDDYNINELIQLFGLPKKFILSQLDDKFIDFLEKNKNIDKHINFLKDAYYKLKKYITTDNIDNSNDVDNSNDPDISSINNSPLILNSDIEKTYDIPLLKGQLNPTLRNVRYRNLNIDSRFRQDITSSSSDFIIDLDEPLKKVTTMTLTNIEIKHSWYTFDEEYGTNYINLDVSNTGNITNKITIPNGNFTRDELINQINQNISSFDISLNFSYTSYNGKVTITNREGVPIRISFYDDDNSLNSKINNNLGWLLGFHDITNIDYKSKIEYIIPGIPNPSSITANTILDIEGTRYLMIAIDDYNKNNINNDFINVYDFDKDFIKMPSYYNTDISLDDPAFLNNGEKSGLTGPQISTIIEIYNQNKIRQNRITGINQSNIFARIQTSIKDNYQVLFISNNTLRYNSRTYFGPCDISRLRITIYNDHGQIINMNGQDFSLMLNIEELYQY